MLEFECLDCGNEYEALTKHNHVDCPKCESSRVRRILSFSGYKIYGDNSASVTPKQASAFKSKK